MNWLLKTYNFINSKFTWDFDKKLLGQRIHFYPTKVLHIFLHISIGFLVGLIGYKCGITVGITIFIYQLIWENLWQYKGFVKYTELEILERRSGILMNVLDGAQYIIGALITLFI